MSTRMKTTAAALTGAVVLASGGYALGSQAGGGDATAKTKRPARVLGFNRGGPPDLSALAGKLGVTTAQLQAAFDALRTQERDAFATKLAAALNIDADKAKQALADLKPPEPPPGPGPGPGREKRDGMASALASKLGLDVAKVRSALKSLGPDDVRSAGGPAAALAKALGVDEAKVRDALQSVRPPGGPGRPGGPRERDHGPDLSALATKLGVTTAQLQAAFDKLGAEKRDEFATKLAEKLGIDPQKVKDALPAEPPHLGHRGFGP